MLSVKKLFYKILTNLIPTSETVSTTIGNVGVWKMGKIVSLDLRGVASNQSGIITITNLPRPATYHVVQLYEGINVNGILYPNNSNQWTMRRVGGTGTLYGSVTYITLD